ncbi:MAG TPA: hypothetical protein VF812_07085 [Ktedonobacterales bacterium]
MKRWLVKSALIAAALAAPLGTLSGVAHAATNPAGTGQPSQSCQSVFPSGTFTPAGFNTAGFNHATTVYAGAQPQNSSNPSSVSQYDVACYQTSQH